MCIRDRFEAVLKIERNARVAKLAGGEGQQLAADLHDHFVDIPLNENGIKQARALAERCLLYTSRCV